jgi:phenylacetate-coenzyme A ligase PaaK-like adenylate-forming protein
VNRFPRGCTSVLACIVEVVEGISAQERYNLVKSRTLNLVKTMQESLTANPDKRDQAIYQSLRRLLKIAITSPWWQDRLERYKNDIETAENLAQLLGCLPVLNRRTLQANSHWMATWVLGSNSEDYSEASTSGSTGKPVTVTKFNPTQGIEYYAGELFSLLLNNVDLNKNIMSYRTRKPPEKNPSPMGEPLSFVGASGQIFYLPNSQYSLDEVLEAVGRHQIQSAIATPPGLRAVVNRIAEVNRTDLRITNVMTFSGRVDPALRELTKKHLGARIIDLYSTAEVGPIAYQCPSSDHLHPTQIINYVEILNSNDLPCAQGEVGRVVVTALGSYGMPLIRYELGDTASWGAPCEFGINLPVLKPEIVRQLETYVNSKGEYVPIVLDRGSFVSNPALRDYLLLIFQDKQVLFLVGDLDFESNELGSIREEVQILSGMDLDVEVVLTPNAPWLQKDKPRTVVFVHERFPEAASIEDFSKYLQVGQP